MSSQPEGPDPRESSYIDPSDLAELDQAFAAANDKLRPWILMLRENPDTPPGAAMTAMSFTNSPTERWMMLVAALYRLARRDTEI